jgi:hypothetical protein
MSEIEKAYITNLDRTQRAQLQAIEKSIDGRLARTQNELIGIGHDLIEAKELLGHGSFMQWAEARYSFTYRHVQNFIYIAEQFGKVENFSNLNFQKSALYALAAPSVPDEVREVAIELARDGETITHQNAQTLIKAAKPKPAAPEPEENESPFVDEVEEIAPPAKPQNELQQRAAAATVVHDTMPEMDSTSGVDEEELTDDEWLASLPIVRYYVAQNYAVVALRRSCLSWRTLHQSKALSQFKHHAARAIVFKDLMNAGELEQAIYAVAHLPHPREWKVCAKCRAKGCSDCSGNGYRLHVGIEADRLNGGDAA